MPSFDWKKITLNFPCVESFCISLYCEYSTQGNGVIHTSHVCAAESSACHLTAGLAAEVVAQNPFSVSNKSCFSKVCEAILSLAHCDYLYKEKNKAWVLWPSIVFLVWNGNLQPCEWTLIPGWHQFWRTVEMWDKTAIFCLLHKE